MNEFISPEILLAGATGELGSRIARALVGRGARVRAIVRPGTPPGRLTTLQDDRIVVVPLDLADARALVRTCEGTTCVVSALNGLEDTILAGQAALLDAAVEAGVPRFIPSDFALDFTKTAPGGNRNLDLRRTFHERLDHAPVRATSILNGGFMDMLAGQMPLIQFRWHRVLYCGDADQPLDFTTMDDVATFTAAAALDATTPRVLRIAGEVASARGLARVASEATGKPFDTLRGGGLYTLDSLIAVARVLAPGRGQVFPIWQGLQYLRDMFSGDGKLAPLDNGRCPDLRWTGIGEVLRARPYDGPRRA